MKNNAFLLALILSLFSTNGYSNYYLKGYNATVKSSLIIPAFNSYGPYCLDSFAPLLPTTSLNGITGSWFPSFINTDIAGDALYVFTPNVGQNATAVTINITTIPQANAGTITGNQNLCVGATTTFTATTTGGIWSSSNPSIATVNPTSGLISGVTAGMATIDYTVNNSPPCPNATVARTITIKPLFTPIISFGVVTSNSIKTDWAAVLAATSYTIVYTINGGVAITATIGNILTYTLAGLSPGDTVNFCVTPTGTGGTCFATGCGATSTTLDCNGANTPDTPTFVITQPTCNVLTGSVTITSELGLTYSLDGGVFSSNLNYFGLLAGSTHTISAKNSAGCISDVAIVTVNNQPSDGATLSLTSTAGTATQSLCINTPIVSIVYTIGNGATGAIVSGLPPGVLGAFNGEIFTISGASTQAGTFNYTLITNGGCGMAMLSGTISVIPLVNIFCDTPLFPNSVAFDWNPVGGITNYNYTYSIDGGPLVSGSTLVSNFFFIDLLSNGVSYF